jgi:superfamily II RNA helicase
MTDPTVDAPLYPRALREGEKLDGEWILSEFLSYVEGTGMELYPAQEEAVLEITQGNNVILNTPTGSGKSLVALAACFSALAYGERAFYTAPIKALVSEKFLALCRVFGPDNVGMMTGDATVNHDAPIICCTAEILSNLALREGSGADLEWVVMDEFHYYSDRERGVAWQVPLLTLPQARFLLMSATLGDTTFFQESITELTGAATVLVKSEERPVPLDFSYVETPLHETIGDLLKQGRAPIYIVHFAQRAASEQAQKLTSIDFLTKEQKAEIREHLRGFRFDSPFGKELSRFIPHGIGVHHAGMLPKYRLLVEKLAQKGLLKVICGTDTLGVGINIPLRTVLFTQLCKYDGDKVRILSVRDFQQIAGRAGRRGFDTQGSVVVQAPEHVIENLAAKRRAEGDAKKLKKLRPKKAPERGYAPWDAKTLEKLRISAPEPLKSRFAVSSGMLLSVLCRTSEDGCKAMKSLLVTCHDTPRQKRIHKRTALSVFRALVEGDIIDLSGERVRVNADLQEDFSLNHALSLFAVQVIESLDREDRNYALIVLSVIESILENPSTVLFKQVDTLKARKLLELKHAGVEYEERMAELEQVTYPKPEKELLWATFDLFSKEHPWVLGNSIAPKSIARDMYELGLSFNAYVKEYGLERAEGVLLRYLSETYRTMTQTIPDGAKTEELSDIIDWLGGELRSTDTSLLEEWQKLSDPKAALEKEKGRQAVSEQEDVTKDRRGFIVLVRNVIWRIVQALSRQDFEGAAGQIRAAGQVPAAAQIRAAAPADPRVTAEELSAALAPFFEEYGEMRSDPSARSPRHLHVEEAGDAWTLRQALVDPEDDLSYRLVFQLNLEECREHGRPVLRYETIETG